MAKKFKVGKLQKEEMLIMDRAISREIELDNGLRINHHRVHMSKKTYNRTQKHKQIWA